MYRAKCRLLIRILKIFLRHRLLQSIRIVLVACCVVYTLIVTALGVCSEHQDADKPAKEMTIPKRFSLKEDERMKIPESRALYYWIFSTEKRIAESVRRGLAEGQEDLLSPFSETTLMSMAGLWKSRDRDAIRLITCCEKEKVIDDQLTFAKRIIADKEAILERIDNPQRYEHYEYQPYLHYPETAIITSINQCVSFAKSDNDAWRKRIVPIIVELNNPEGLLLLENMAVNDPSITVRKTAAFAWVLLSMPEELIHLEQVQSLMKQHEPFLREMTGQQLEYLIKALAEGQRILFEQISADQQKWLRAFVESEKKKGKNANEWAIWAAQQVLEPLGNSLPGGLGGD